MKNALKEIYREDAKPARFLAVLLLSGIAYGLYKGIQDNYLAQIAGVGKSGRGVVEFFREMPGLLVMFLLAFMYKFSESRIFKIGTAIMTAGVFGLLMFSRNKFIIVAFVVLYSFGEHISMPVKSTISLELAKHEKGGASLGITSALAQMGNIAGYIAVTVLFLIFTHFGIFDSLLMRFKTIFLISFILVSAALIIALTIKTTGTKTVRRRFYFAKKFSKYYLLEVFYGARKQIFFTFAPYVLILQYGADTHIIAFLLAACALCCTVASPLTGMLIDRLGYKFIMVIDTLLLLPVCFFYGFSHLIFPAHIAFVVVCVNYILDSVISLASMASNVYVQSLSSSHEELTATLSTGISVNHFISIFIALAGGILWEVLGVEALFTMSGILGIINSIYAATIRTKNASGA